METDGFNVSVSDRIAEVTLDRPPVNAFTTAMYESFAAGFRGLSARDDVDVVLVRSASEKVFSAGADIGELEKIVNSGTSELDERRQVLAREFFDAVLNGAQPSIAVINGPALGTGAVLAACCDIRYGSTRARIGLPEINVARCGGGRHMMRLLPQGVVRRMYLSGQPLRALDAERHGYLNAVLEPGEELDAARELARTIASKSPHALRLAKQALNGCESLPVSEGYALEQTFTLRLAASADAAEAARAFLEKRDPVWTGR
jgi:enoyl-CoA hydratase/carnithine racemase